MRYSSSVLLSICRSVRYGMTGVGLLRHCVTRNDGECLQRVKVVIQLIYTRIHPCISDYAKKSGRSLTGEYGECVMSALGKDSGLRRFRILDFLKPFSETCNR